jgi:hypothetical protein
LHLDQRDKLGVRLGSRPAGELALPDLGGHASNCELFVSAAGVETDVRGVGDEDHLVERPDERLNAHFEPLMIEGKARRSRSDRNVAVTDRI